jgi:hypothetical protein
MFNAVGSWLVTARLTACSMKPNKIGTVANSCHDVAQQRWLNSTAPSR